LIQIFLTQLAIKRPFEFPPHPMCASALPGENETDKISENIPNVIDCKFKQDDQILIAYGKSIPDTTGHQMTVQAPTSPNVCFCTTWGGNFNSRSVASCAKNILTKNYYVISANRSSSYNRYCWDSVVAVKHVGVHTYVCRTSCGRLVMWAGMFWPVRKLATSLLNVLQLLLNRW